MLSRLRLCWICAPTAFVVFLYLTVIFFVETQTRQPKTEQFAMYSTESSLESLADLEYSAKIESDKSRSYTMRGCFTAFQKNAIRCFLAILNWILISIFIGRSKKHYYRKYIVFKRSYFSKRLRIVACNGKHNFHAFFSTVTHHPVIVRHIGEQ